VIHKGRRSVLGLRFASTSSIASLLATLALAPCGFAQEPRYCVQAPCGLQLVGTQNGVADPHGEITLAIGVGPECTPLPNAEVTLDFTFCQTDLRLCSTQPGWPGSVACPLLAGLTDETGAITFRLVGGGHNTGNPAGYAGDACAGGCLTVLVNGTAAARLSVAAFDEDGSGGVGPPDVSLWLDDAFSGLLLSRSDFDFTNDLTPVDLALLLAVSLHGESVQSCEAYCF